jgi:hypothetical protein
MAFLWKSLAYKIEYVNLSQNFYEIDPSKQAWAILPIEGEMNTMVQDRMGQELRLIGWDCFRISLSRLFMNGKWEQVISVINCQEQYFPIHSCHLSVISWSFFQSFLGHSCHSCHFLVISQSLLIKSWKCAYYTIL